MIGSKISRRYAKALLSIGQEEGRYEEYGKNLKEFADFCLANGEFYRIISNRIFSLEDRRKVLDAVLVKSGFTDTVKNFLRLLLDKDRMVFSAGTHFDSIMMSPKDYLDIVSPIVIDAKKDSS